MYENNKPYPEVLVERRNPYYAKLLLIDYASNCSEDTAIHEYFYQSLMVDDKELSETLMQISKVEMHHLRLLGKAISLLGIKPVFGVLGNNTLTPWTSKYVNYSVKVEDMLKIDIKQEKTAIDTYQKHIKEIDDRYIKSLLERIVEDEIIHLKTLYTYLKKLKVVNA